MCSASPRKECRESIITALKTCNQIGIVRCVNVRTCFLPFAEIRYLQLGDSLLGKGIKHFLLLFGVKIITGGGSGLGGFVHPALLLVGQGISLILVHQNNAAAKGMGIRDEIGRYFVEGI